MTDPSVPVPSVFIVEDEAIVALDLQVRLERLGLRVVAVVGSDAELGALARRLQPDLIVLDAEPRDGRDGAAVVRQLRGHAAAPILLLTAYADDALRACVQAEGAMAIVTKPFDTGDLQRTILALLAARGPHR